MSVDTRALTESRSLLSGAMLAAWTLLFPGLGFAQLVDSRAPAPGVHVAERPDATLVAVAVVIPVGSAQDPQGAPGTARFLAEAIAHSVRQRVDAYPSWVDVRVERSWTAFTLLTTKEFWVRSWVAVEDGLFRLPLEEHAREEVRPWLLAALTFEDGAPAREFQRELYQVLAGTRHPWGRDPRGAPGTIDAVDPKALEEFRILHYVATLAVAVVVGPVSEQVAREALYPVGNDARRTAMLGGKPAWTEGSCLALEREVTNAWIGVAFPAAPNQRRTLLDFLAFQLQEELNPSPPGPGLYSATVYVEDAPRGPVLIAQATVVPEVSALWERRILRAMERAGEQEDDPLFRWQRRRFRSASLLREAQPEIAALRMALDLAREGRTRSLESEISEIDAQDLGDTAGSLANPRVLLMGPELRTP